MNRVVFPHPPPQGGPGTFQQYLEEYLQNELGYEIKYAGEELKREKTLIFVNAGTRKILWLIKQKLEGKKIIQRLDGVNWRHRHERNKLTIYYFKSLATNILVAAIRRYIADAVIYQSKFIKQDWIDKYGTIKTKEFIIYNATNLAKYYPQNPNHYPTSKTIKIVGVEGNIQFDLFTVQTLKNLDTFLKKKNIDYSIDIYGGYEKKLQEYIHKENLDINLRGKVERDRIAHELRNYDIYFTFELFPPCPNSVIEALASGLAITGYNTGALKELVGENCGALFQVQSLSKLPNLKPDYSEFETMMIYILQNYRYMKSNARKHAEKYFDKNNMLKKYIHVIQELIN